MRLHPNAKLTPKTRRLLVDRVRRLGWPVARSARAAGVSRQTAYKWLNRFQEGGDSALADRSCRPRRIPVRTPQRTIRRMERLRRRKKPAWEIAQELNVPVSTVSKHLNALGLGRISDLRCRRLRSGVLSSCCRGLRPLFPEFRNRCSA